MTLPLVPLVVCAVNIGHSNALSLLHVKLTYILCLLQGNPISFSCEKARSFIAPTSYDSEKIGLIESGLIYQIAGILWEYHAKISEFYFFTIIQRTRYSPLI